MILDKRKKLDQTKCIWSTQFNDLRVRNPNKADFISELKKTYLFHDNSVIRDADIINHPYLIDSFIENPFLLRDSAFVPALRDSIESFSELNKITGENRAFPEKYKEVEPYLLKLDEYIHKTSKRMDNGIIATLPAQIPTDHFKIFVERIISNAPDDARLRTTLIAEAKNYAMEESQGGHLSFGKMYKWLTTSGKLYYDTKEIQCLRLAHNLVVPAETGLATNISDKKIQKNWLDIIEPDKNTINPVVNDTSVDIEKLIGLYPVLIPEEGSLVSIPFSKLQKIRQEERISGEYFSALDKLLEVSNSGVNFYPQLERYLECLGEYLKRIGLSETKVNFINWQGEIEKHFDYKLQELNSFKVKYGIPFTIRAAAATAGAGAGVGIAYGLSTLIPDVEMWNKYISYAGIFGGAITLLGPGAADAYKDKTKKEIEKANRFRSMIKDDTNYRVKENF